jgi:putative transposase
VDCGHANPPIRRLERGPPGPLRAKGALSSLRHDTIIPHIRRMGAKGWHSRGYLPHYDSHDIVQHVVFRLHDAVPPEAMEGDDILDRHLGSAFMRDARCARAVAETLLHHDQKHFALQAWCVMPNHVHALVSTNEAHELGNVVRTWKTFSARRINDIVGRSGPVWARDYFDRYVRDEKQFEAAKRYIEMNPVSAGLCDRPEAWPFGSAGWHG